MFVGALCGGRWFSDKIGRKKGPYRDDIMVFAVITASTHLRGMNRPVRDKILDRVGLSSMTVVAMTYVSEMFRRAKEHVSRLDHGHRSVWNPIFSLVARVAIPLGIFGWRLIFVWGATRNVCVVFASKIQESPHWFENKGRLAEADAVLDRIEKGRVTDAVRFQRWPRRPLRSRNRKVGGLFSPAYRVRTLMLIGVYVFQTLGLFGFMAWVPTRWHRVASRWGIPAADQRLYFGAPVGALIASQISDRWQAQIHDCDYRPLDWRHRRGSMG